MSVEFWKTAEFFYETLLPIMGITIGVLFMVVQYTRMYGRGKAKKVVVRGTLLILSLMIGYGVWGYKHYNEYLSKVKLSTPLIRDREKGIFGYKYYSWNELRTYKRFNDTEGIRKLDFYAETKVEEPVAYLGKGHYYHYFEDKNEKLFKLEKGIHFEPDADQSEMVGFTFQLKEKDFEEVGFFDPERIMYETVVIPMDEQGKVFEQDDDSQIPMAVDRFFKWSFD